MFADEQRYLDYLEAPFLARLTSVQVGTGSQANLQMYGFTEQVFDPSTGFPTDASPARTGSPANTGDTYAVEASNIALTVPGSTPSGYSNAGPYVWLRLKGLVNGIPVYEFDAGNTFLTVKDGTTTVSNVTTLKFTSGATVTNAGGGEADVAISASSSFSGAQFSGLPATTCGTGATTSLSQATGTTIYDTGSPAYGLTLKAPVAGYYAGVFTMVMTSGTTAFAAHVVTSGAQQLADSVTNSGTAGGSLNVSWQGHLAANETVALQVFQASGGNTTCNIKSQSIAKIG